MLALLTGGAVLSRAVRDEGVAQEIADAVSQAIATAEGLNRSA